MATLQFECPSCGKNHQGIKPSLAGKKVRCQCGLVIRLGPKNTKEKAPSTSNLHSDSNPATNSNRQDSKSLPANKTPLVLESDKASREPVVNKRSAGSASAKRSDSKKLSPLKSASKSRSTESKPQPEPAQPKRPAPVQAKADLIGDGKNEGAARTRSNQAAAKSKSPSRSKALHINSNSDFDAPTPDHTRLETKTQKGDQSGTHPNSAPPTLDDFPQSFSPLDCPDQFGKFQILSQLGEGGMGLVFLAKDTELDRLVALKIPKASNDRGTIDRFFREARSAANIHHPNVCTLFEFGEIDGQRFLTMEHVDGKTISQIIRAGDAPGYIDSAKLICQLAETLAEAHAKGVIHRDIKPSNIMIDHRGRPVVMDFGLARREANQEVQLTQHGLLVGTPAYASPEQIKNEEGKLDGRSDVYSLGVVFYILLTGRLPFEGTSFTSVLAKVLTEQPTPPSGICDDLPFELNRICLLAMTKQVEDRYQSMTELAIDLKNFCESLDSPSASNDSKNSYEPVTNESDFALPDVSDEDFDSF